MPAWMQDIVAREGRRSNTPCCGCKSVNASWRCLDCLGRQGYCMACFREQHRKHLFHRVECWTGTFFKPAWLCQAGLELQLGHGGENCPTVPANNDVESVGDLDDEDEAAEDAFDEADIDLDGVNTAGRSDSEDTSVDEDSDTSSEAAEATPSGAAAGDQLTEDDVAAAPLLEPDHTETDGVWEDVRETRKRRGRDVEYGNGLPALKGGNVIVFVDTSGVHRFRVITVNALLQGLPTGSLLTWVSFLQASQNQKQCLRFEYWTTSA